MQENTTLMHVTPKPNFYGLAAPQKVVAARMRNLRLKWNGIAAVRCYRLSMIRIIPGRSVARLPLFCLRAATLVLCDLAME